MTLVDLLKEIANLSDSDLETVNRHVRSIILLNKEKQASAAKAQFQEADRVTWRHKNKVYFGIVLSIGPKNIKVIEEADKFTTWRIYPTFLKKAEEE